MLQHLPHIISFSGRMASGKDTYASTIKNKYPQYKHFSFASALKDEVFDIMSDLFIQKHSIRKVAKKYNVSEFVMSNVHDTSVEQFDIELFTHHPDPKGYLLERRPFTRWLLQYWGTDVRRKQSMTYWLDKARNILSDTSRYFVITDARFTNELELVQELGGEMILLQLTAQESIERIRQRDDIEVTLEQLNHPSETDFLNFTKWSFIIPNGDLQLWQQRLLDYIESR